MRSQLPTRREARRVAHQNRPPSRTVQNLLDRHAKLREAHVAAFAAVETADAPDSKLTAKRDAAFAKLAPVAAKLRERGYTLEHDDSAPVAPASPATPKSSITREQLEAAAKLRADGATELHKTGRKYRNLRGRGEAALYPAHRLPAQGLAPTRLLREFDALAARQAGIAAVTTTGGADTWPEGWDDLARHYCVTVTYDRGEEPWAERVADRLGARVIHLPADLPRGTDLARLSVERGPDRLRRIVGWSS